MAFDLCITGGGLAGLSLSIQMARAGYRVCLCEKEQYPFHRVCGEYISMESWDFLQNLGVPLESLDLPRISELTVTSPNGKSIQHTLPLGGFGISRYRLDHTLSQIARDAGVTLMEHTSVNDIQFQETNSTEAGTNQINEGHHIIDTGSGRISAKLAAGTFGKRASFDIKWKRSFALNKPGPLNNYIGVKYHIQHDFPRNRIVLHNFSNGYCGMSAIEGDLYCLCYLTTAENLRRSGQSIQTMEREILCKNPFLQEIFSNARFIWPQPLTIAQISFEQKELIHDHVLMTGDAAGMITPLCGNGMSMALHGSTILCGYLSAFLQGKINRDEMEKNYTDAWKKQFGNRLKTGRYIQRFFGRPTLTNLFVSILKPFPTAVDLLIRQTHGTGF